MMNFSWDAEKNEYNIKKHSVSFTEAKTVFFDENALLINDPDHSEEEERFIIMGLSSCINILIVCHCYRDDEQTIRIISARKATKNEVSEYER